MRDGFYKYHDSEADSNQLLCVGIRHYTLLYGNGVDAERDNAAFVWRKDYDHKPDRSELRADIEGLINGLTDDNILRGYVWKENPVWLSSENQFNFKAAYDLAFQTNGASLPARYKLGEDKDGNPIYYDFEDLATFQDFYLGAITWIQKCINAGWEEKDAVDYDKLLNQ